LVKAVGTVVVEVDEVCASAVVMVVVSAMGAGG
jgi:hypothetical protein